jgi:hypothetical protein
MRPLAILTLCLFLCCFEAQLHAQPKTDAFLKDLIFNNASPALKLVLQNPDSFHYQLIYTKIDRDRKNRPHFTSYFYHVDSTDYFNPASTVKMPLAFLALEKINRLKKFGIDKNTPMLTDSAYAGQTSVLKDSSSASGLPSVAHYIKKIFLVSDNDAYNRLYEFIGQQTINEQLRQKGYPGARITRRFVPMDEDQNRHTNTIRFLNGNRLLYEQPAAYSQFNFDFSRKVLVGKAHYNAKEELIQQPMDFTTHNNIALEDLHRILQTVLFPESFPLQKRFNLTPDDYRFLYQYMSEYPSESKFPRYDTTEYFNAYTKFFMFKSGKSNIPPYIRVFNKPGWSYGFLTDVAYIVDFRNKIEFLVSGTIYVNSDGVLNDDKYEYDQTGYPFFKEVGNIIYQYERSRPRKHTPDLKKFILTYSN